MPLGVKYVYSMTVISHATRNTMNVRRFDNGRTRLPAALGGLILLVGGSLFIDDTAPAPKGVPWLVLSVVMVGCYIVISERAVPRQRTFQLTAAGISLIGALGNASYVSERGSFPWVAPLLGAGILLMFIALAPAEIRPEDLKGGSTSKDLSLVPGRDEWLGYILFATPFIVLGVLIAFF